MLTPNEECLKHGGTILHYIQAQDDGMEFTYIIIGRSGPTGKTWLCSKLNACGYKAIEISEDIYHFVDYIDDKNHFHVNNAKKYVVIGMNKLLRHG
jgi:hypothetical protein